MTNLNGFITVGTVVDYWQRLLETSTSNTNNISYQLTDGDHHLKDKEREKIQYCKYCEQFPSPVWGLNNTRINVCLCQEKDVVWVK